MHEKKLSLFIVFIISVLFVLLNTVFFPKLYIVHLFAIVFLVLTYKRFAFNLRKYLYYTTIVFAIIDFSLLLPLGSRYGVYYFYVSLFFYFVIIFLDGTLKNNLPRLKNKYTIFALVFLVYLLFSTLLAHSKSLAVKSIILYVIMLLFSIMFIIENDNKQALERTFAFLKYIFFGVVILGLFEVLGFSDGVRNHFADMGLTVADYPFLRRVPVVFFYNPNNYGVFLVLGMSLIFILFVTSKVKWQKVLAIVTFILAQINLIFTTSRTAWITLIVSLLFCSLFFILRKEYRGIKPLVQCMLLVFFIFALFSALPGMESYYGKFNSTPILRFFNIDYMTSSKKAAKPMPIELGGQNSTSERMTLMVDVVNGVFKQGHILGFGPGNTIDYIKALNNTYGVIDIHSLWFEVLGDFGLFIFLYFIYIYLSIQIELLKAYKHVKVGAKYYFMMGCCIFSFIFLAFAPSSVISFPPFWMLMGLSIALLYNKEKIQG